MSLYALRKKIQERIDKIEESPLSRDDKNSSQLELIICKQWLNEETNIIESRVSQLEKEHAEYYKVIKKNGSDKIWWDAIAILPKIEASLDELRGVLGND